MLRARVTGSTPGRGGPPDPASAGDNPWNTNIFLQINYDPTIFFSDRRIGILEGRKQSNSQKTDIQVNTRTLIYVHQVDHHNRRSIRTAPQPEGREPELFRGHPPEFPCQKKAL